MALKTLPIVQGLSRTPLLFVLDISPPDFSKICCANRNPENRKSDNLKIQKPRFTHKCPVIKCAPIVNDATLINPRPPAKKHGTRVDAIGGTQADPRKEPTCPPTDDGEPRTHNTNTREPTQGGRRGRDFSGGSSEKPLRLHLKAPGC